MRAGKTSHMKNRAEVHDAREEARGKVGEDDFRDNRSGRIEKREERQLETAKPAENRMQRVDGLCLSASRPVSQQELTMQTKPPIWK